MKKSIFIILSGIIALAYGNDAFAQRQQQSPYGPALSAYYNSIDAGAGLEEGRGQQETRRPLIGVSVSSSMKATCTKSIELAGGIPLIIPVSEDISTMEALLYMLDGVMFSGGEDINPSWYEEEKSEKCGSINDKRDYYELMLFKMAMDRNIPILGVCRGLQMVNVAMGGSLIQDIPSEHPSEIKHGVYDNSLVPAHDIRIEGNSLLSDILGRTELGVNSRHHQGIDRLAKGLKATAWSPDGIIEAVEAYPARQIMAVQFHPELNTAAGDTVQLKIFKHFVSQASLFARAKDIHSRIISVDTHCDTPLGFSRGGSLGARSHQQVSIPKMREGYLDAQYLAAFLSQRDEDGESLAKAAASCESIIASIHQQIEGNAYACGLAVTMEDALKLKAEGKKAFFIGIENGYGLGGDLRNIKKFRDLGVGYITLCHSYDNMICHSSTRTEDENLGLTEFGRKVVKEMNRLGVLIDLSHASRGTFYDVMKYSKLPVICSHSGAKDVYSHDRNLDDEQLRALKANGGVIQICIFSGYLSGDPEGADIDDLIEHIEHCIKVAGIDHVGIGSDFDGGGGIIGVEGSNNMIRITEKLLEKGYSEEELAKIWGGNFFRVLAQNQAAARK